MIIEDEEVKITKDELRVLLNSINSKSVSEISKKTGLQKAFILNTLKTFKKIGTIMFMPDFQKMGLHLGLVFAKDEKAQCRVFQKAFGNIPHVVEHFSLMGKSVQDAFLVMADRKTLPDLLASDFTECFEFYDIESVEGWNTVLVRDVIEKLEPEKLVTVSEIALRSLKIIQEKAKNKEELKRVFEEARKKEFQSLPRSTVYYMDLDEYDVKILDYKVIDAYASISKIADEFKLYRQMLHYHYVNHIIPLWKGNIVRWRSSAIGASFRLLQYRGPDIDIVNEYYRILPYTLATLKGKDVLFVFSALPVMKIKEIKTFIMRYNLNVTEEGEWIIEIKFIRKHPFSSIYTKSGWLSIEESFRKAKEKEMGIVA
ncbi:MAG: hypothetical protein DRJ35_03895 [Thermoprotei archaeon]|nr:MAG: hypothetical protein DRJ35_03895 [Thermoprotei archaeon]